MSAFLVSKAHIDLLVNLDLHGPSDLERSQPWGLSSYSPDELGKLLWGENLRSFRTRYPGLPKNRSIAYSVANYEFQPPPYQLTLVEANKALHCLRYQSCETDDYETTLAAQWTNEMLSTLEHCVPGYELAPWHWSEDVIKERAAAANLGI